MEKKIIYSDKVAKPVATYSQGALAGNHLFIAGMTAFNAQGEFVGKGDVKAQTRQVMENIKGVVEAAGGKMEDIVQTTLYVTDLANFPKAEEVYKTYFPKDPPPRASLRVDLVRPEYLVEISAIAVIG
jgi:reactive intermediate/imine deaminase